MVITTTHDKIRKTLPYRRADGKYDKPDREILNRYDNLVAALDKQDASWRASDISFATILRFSDLPTALYYCKVEPGHQAEWWSFALWCAKRVQHLMRDERSLLALAVAERLAAGEKISSREMVAAKGATWTASLVNGRDPIPWVATLTLGCQCEYIASLAPFDVWSCCTPHIAIEDGERKFLEIVGDDNR